MRSGRLFVALLACGLLTSCYTVYSDSTSAQSAALDFVKSPEQKVGAMSYVDPLQCADRRILVPINEDQGRTLVVPANEPFTYTLGMDTGATVHMVGTAVAGMDVRGCNPTITFVPQVGKRYRTQLIRTGQHTCEIELTELRDDMQVPAPHAVRQYRTPLTAKKPSCADTLDTSKLSAKQTLEVAPPTAAATEPVQSPDTSPSQQATTPAAPATSQQKTWSNGKWKGWR